MQLIRKLLILCSPAILIVSLFLMTGYAPESLVFNREAIAQGEIWRLFTGHFVHCDAEHLIFNVLGVLGLGLVFNKLSGKEIWLALATGMIAVNSWIWIGMKDLNIYCGLSALENTLLVVGLRSFWINDNKLMSVIIGLVTMTKISIEVATQGSIFTNTSWQPVPQTHAAGFLAGLLLILIIGLANNRIIKGNKLSFAQSGVN